MARTSDDLYDSYRNMFLAFECLLSEIHSPMQENETEWFKTALTKADKLVSLETLTKPGKHTNHVKWVMKHMYERERCALMHVKQNQDKNFLLPQDHLPRAELTASLGRLWCYISNLILKRYGMNRRGFDWSADVFARFAKPILCDQVVVISDDETPAANSPDAESAIPDGSRLVELQSDPPAVDPDEPRLWTVLAHCGAANLKVLTAVRKFDVKDRTAGSPAKVVSELVGPMHLGGSVVRFEVVHGLRYVNPLIAPSQFSS